MSFFDLPHLELLGILPDTGQLTALVCWAVASLNPLSRRINQTIDDSYYRLQAEAAILVLHRVSRL